MMPIISIQALEYHSMPKTTSSLSSTQLAALFTQLRQLESAGLPAFQAFSVLTESESRLKISLALMQRQLKSGRPISEAGFSAGIFSETQKKLIQAAEISGRLEDVYGQLAGYYTALSGRVNKVRSRLYFPALTLIIAIFAQPLPDLFRSAISAGEYFQLSLGRLLAFATGVFLLVRLPDVLRGLGLEAPWHRLQLASPVISRWIIARQINEFFFILAMLLEAGLAFSEALPKSVAAIKNVILREHFNRALATLGSGASVTDTLSEVTVINDRMLSIVDSIEQSGKLSSGILHFTQLEAEALRLEEDALAAWLPRLIYSLIAFWMAYSILDSPFGTGAGVIP